MAQQIADAIDQQGSVVAVLSKKSKPGDWLPPELANPPAKHKSDGRDVLFAVSVDDSWETLVSPTWNQLTRQQNVFDFSDWMDDEHFDMSFDMLGHALRVRCTPVDASR